MVYSRKQNKRKTGILILSFLVILICVIVTLVYFSKKNTYQNSLGLIINGNDYFLEVAQNTKQQKIGLSKRNEICTNCGMLFVFNQEGEHQFWMKNTYIPLDMIWLNSEKQIVKIINAAPVDSETVYTNKDPAKYVIELKANETLKLKLKIGDTIPFELKPNESSN